MSNDSVIIKISGDIKDFTDKLDAIQKKTADFSKAINTSGIAAGATFALITAGSIKAVSAFKDSIRPAAELQNILKNQGIHSEKLVEEYGNIAKELKKITGVDDELITSGQAVIQRFAGQTKVTKEFTQAILDFSAATGVDTVTAFNLVGKSIGTSTNALSKYGIEIASNLSVQEKISVFIANANAKFRDQAKILNETAGPLARLTNAFGNVEEKIGEKLAPTIDSIAGALENLADKASESDNLGTVISSVALALGGLAGSGVVLASVAKGIVAVAEASAVLGISAGAILSLTGAIGLAVGGLIALKVYFDKLEKESKATSIEDAQNRIIKNQEKIDRLRKEQGIGGANQSFINTLEQINKGYQKQVDTFKEIAKLNDQKKLQVESDKKELAKATELNKQAEVRKKLEEQKLAAIEKEKQARLSLAESLVDAGKSEIQALEDLRDRRIKLAAGDKNLLLLIEKDFQTKKYELEKKNDENIRDLREAQFEYEKKLIQDRDALISKASGSPLQGFLDASKETDPEKKKNIAGGAAAGLLNQVSSGKEGAKNLVVEGGALAIDALAPGIGQALKPLLGGLTQGPEATKAFVKEFTDAIPDLIEGLIEAIPVLIEELANQTPVIIDRLVEKAPKIIESLVKSAPKVIEALALQAPRIILALVDNIPTIISSFIDGLIQGAGEFVNALIDAVNPFSSDGAVGGFISDVGDFLGFAEGGSASVKRVPSGFAGDRFPAFLSSDELVVKPDVARDLESFLGNQGSGSSYDAGLLNQILKAVSAPVVVNTDVSLNNKTFANILLDFSRSNARTS